MIETEGLISVREAAVRSGRSAATIRRWVRDGKVPAHRIGNQLLIRESDLLVKGSADQRRIAAGLVALENARLFRERMRAKYGDIDFGLVEELRRQRAENV